MNISSLQALKINHKKIEKYEDGNMIKKLIIFIAIPVSMQSAKAEDCLSVIALSRERMSTISSKDSLEQAASNFCNEYSSAKSQGKSMSLGVSYLKLAGSFGSSSTSVEEVASKYCSSAKSYERATDAYQQYVDSIAPGAFGAYQQCLALRNSDVKFTVDEASTLPKHIVMTVNYTSSSGPPSPASFQFVASGDIKCSWKGKIRNIIKGNTINIASPGTAYLDCKRPNESNKGFITIIRSDGNNRITLPWPAYNPEGVPVNTLVELTQRVDTLERNFSQLVQSAAATHTLASSVESRLEIEKSNFSYTIVQAASECPSGWTNLGAIGIIGLAKYQNKEPVEFSRITLNKGGWLNKDWRFVHPVLCRR